MGSNEIVWNEVRCEENLSETNVDSGNSVGGGRGGSVALIVRTLPCRFRAELTGHVIFV